MGIDKYLQIAANTAIERVLKDVNNYLTYLDSKNSSLSITDLYENFKRLIAFNSDLKIVDIKYVRQYKTTINRFPRYFQKYCNVYSNYIDTVIKDLEEKNKPLEELSKEELIAIIRSKE